MSKRNKILLIVSLLCATNALTVGCTEQRVTNTQPLSPVTSSSVSMPAVLTWSNEAAVAAFSYNYADYPSNLQSASRYFTPRAWDAFRRDLRYSGNLNTVIKKKLVVSAVATAAPIVLRDIIVQGTRVWVVQMPLLVTYQNATLSYQQHVIVTLRVIRITSGLAIDQFNTRTQQNF